MLNIFLWCWFQPKLLLSLLTFYFGLRTTPQCLGLAQGFLLDMCSNTTLVGALVTMFSVRDENSAEYLQSNRLNSCIIFMNSYFIYRYILNLLIYCIILYIIYIMYKIYNLHNIYNIIENWKISQIVKVKYFGLFPETTQYLDSYLQWPRKS